MKSRKNELTFIKAKATRQKSPGEYRLDPYGHTIRYATYPAQEAEKEMTATVLRRRKSAGKLRRDANLEKAGCRMKKETRSKSH